MNFTWKESVFPSTKTVAFMWTDRTLASVSGNPKPIDILTVTARRWRTFARCPWRMCCTSRGIYRDSPHHSPRGILLFHEFLGEGGAFLYYSFSCFASEKTSLKSAFERSPIQFSHCERVRFESSFFERSIVFIFSSKVHCVIHL